MEAGNDSTFISSSVGIAGRKEGLPHVRKRSKTASPQKQRQSSLPAWYNKMRLRWSTRSQRPTQTMIPQGLSDKEISHYETLIDVVKARRDLAIKQPRVVVITDLAKDYDDLAAMVVLKELHRLGVVTLLGFIANLMPALKRAQFGRGALDSLGLRDIPIAQGTSGFPDSDGKKHDELPYEFDCDFMATDDTDDRIGKERNGETLLHRLCEEAVRTEEKITLVLISSLEDIYTFSKRYPDLLKNAVSNIVLQGGYTISPEGKLEPDFSANNNRYDKDAASFFHTFMQDNHIESAVYTKVAAYATPLNSDIFGEMAETKHPLGLHLKKVQVEQDVAFYKSASNEPAGRFAPFMDQKWFLTNKTNWYEKLKEAAERKEGAEQEEPEFPKGEEVIPYLTKVIVYDALAALGSSGRDALEALKVLTPGQTPPHSIHQIVGFAGPPSDPGVDSEQMISVLSALLKGSLLSCPPQGYR